jgi:hypothetical protein
MNKARGRRLTKHFTTCLSPCSAKRRLRTFLPTVFLSGARRSQCRVVQRYRRLKMDVTPYACWPLYLPSCHIQGGHFGGASIYLGSMAIMMSACAQARVRRYSFTWDVLAIRIASTALRYRARHFDTIALGGRSHSLVPGSRQPKPWVLLAGVDVEPLPGWNSFLPLLVASSLGFACVCACVCWCHVWSSWLYFAQSPNCYQSPRRVPRHG